MAWILALMGVGSAFYHASETTLGMWLDWAGMYAMTGFMGAFALGRAFGVRARGRMALFAALLGIGLFSLGLPRSFAREIFVVTSLLCPVLEAFLAVRPQTRAPSYRWFFAAYAALAPAVVLWALDQRGLLCNPENHVLSGHGAWHLLDAFMFWCSFRFYAGLPPSAATGR